MTIFVFTRCERFASRKTSNPTHTSWCSLRGTNYLHAERQDAHIQLIILVISQNLPLHKRGKKTRIERISAEPVQQFVANAQGKGKFYEARRPTMNEYSGSSLPEVQHKLRD